MTQHLINEAGGIRTYIETQELSNPQHQGWRRVRIYTTYESSRDPEYQQNQLDLCLEPGAFANLKAVVNSL